MPKRGRTPAMEAAQYDREARVLELRAQGWTFAQIADECGFAYPAGASKAYHRALHRKPAQGVEDIRAQESERLEYMWRKTADIIESPPLQHSAIGKTIPDPRPGHEGEWLIDESARIRAIETYRKLSESYRKMTGADISDTGGVNAREQAQMLREVETYIGQLEREVNRQRMELDYYRAREGNGRVHVIGELES